MDHFEVLATSDLAARDTRVLKAGETFAIFDVYGDIQPISAKQAGVFYRGTRFVSHSELKINNERPLLLHSTLRDDNGTLVVDLTNRDLGTIPKGTIHLHREKFLGDSKSLEQVTLSNFGQSDVELELSVRVGADFADIFEVRGTKRVKRGELRSPHRSGHFLFFPYNGLDNVERTSVFYCSNNDFRWSQETISIPVKIPKQGKATIRFIQSFFIGSASEIHPDYDQALDALQQSHSAGRLNFCDLQSSNEQFNGWIRRSTDDLVMMTTRSDTGSLYPYAGIPWFCCPFGRDGLITSIECLWTNPALAKGVLEFLGKHQSSEEDPKRDANPGKILHEARDGEMASLGEIPFGRYFGTVDATPLFVALGGLYLERTNDLEFTRRLWPNYLRGIEWMEKYGDADGDGFIEYFRASSSGLVNQGWKDSDNSVFHADGSPAVGSIALSEVQGYAYLAYVQAARIARALGEDERGEAFDQRAKNLKQLFDDAFWLDDLGCYALALDGSKKPCRVISSNAGQCLFTEIVKAERASRLVETLMRPDVFTGWGLRTVGTTAPLYNPMSYHNGSVWPHDTALIAWGMSKYGYKEHAVKLFDGLFKAASYMELERIPEVFCGFPRRQGEAPTLYPTACSPQAWSAASVFLGLQALLGLSVNAQRKRVHFEKPVLPESVSTVEIKNLSVGDAKIDLSVQNYRDDVSIQIHKRNAGILVTVEK